MITRKLIVSYILSKNNFIEVKWNENIPNIDRNWKKKIFEVIVGNG